MSNFLDITNNPNEFAENDSCIINLITGSITWKPGMYNPKSSNNIRYWLKLKEQTNRLWDQRGYDLPYLKSLTEKQFTSLYDTEFYVEDNF